MEHALDEMPEHRLDPQLFHHLWDRHIEPALSIRSGDVVDLSLKMAGAGQIREGDSYADTRFDSATLYRLAGPIHVAGASAGDTLRIDVLSLEPGDWGWCGTEPGLGLLPDDFPEPFVRTYDLRGADAVRVCPQVTIPLAPFLGTMGTHPGEPPRLPVFPPHAGGGNIDTRHLTAGSSLWLPVWCDGALFSCGDPHGVQGDGEVCLAALECDMHARLRLTVERRTIGAPRFRTAGPLARPVDTMGHHGTMGIGPDLLEGARAAVRESIAWLVGEHGLTPQDAYVTCSLAGDLRILEIVDDGVYNVGFTIPLGILNAHPQG
ncbi:MAG TPA: acetamidase/formamidase family protein [Solirubrobacteraceae bacterium]|nr:acetamidase/formamidase family protein [Solirubrobacteraceae bacterium]